MDQLPQLVDFLRNPQKEVRHIAVQNLASYVPSNEAQEVLSSNENLLPNLKLLLGDLDYIAKEAYVCLLQLSTSTIYCKKMIDAKLIPILMDTVCDKENLFVEVALIILGNISRLEDGKRALLQEGTDFEGIYLFKLIEKFCSPLADPKRDAYQWVGSILTNLSQSETGRQILVSESGRLLIIVASANLSESLHRKRGISATIKNCCFSMDSHEELLKSGILNFLVTPLVGASEQFTPEEVSQMPASAQKIISESNRQPETDREVIEPALESLVMLCTSRESRSIMRLCGLYYILREFDKLVTNADIKELIVKIVDLLIRDEMPIVPDEAEQTNEE